MGEFSPTKTTTGISVVARLRCENIAILACRAVFLGEFATRFLATPLRLVHKTNDRVCLTENDKFLLGTRKKVAKCHVPKLFYITLVTRLVR